MPALPVTAALIVHEGRLLIARRRQGKAQAGLWEFPGGKIEQGESPEKALERELGEELGVSVKVGKHFMTVEHTYPKFTIHLMAYFVEAMEAITASTDHDRLAWICPKDWRDYDFAPADIPIVEALQDDPLFM